jgi:homoserine kinase type II
MAVYTKIISKDIHLINSKFNIDEIKSFQGIKKGIENTNYLLKTKKEKFILTIFEKRVSNNEIPFFMKLMDNLNQSKISCPKPLKDKNGNYLIKLKNKTACVVTFLKGKDKQTLNLNNCYQVGKIISQMHYITKKLKFSRKNSMGIKKLNPLLKSIKFKTKKNSNLEKFLIQNLNNIKKNWPSKLPCGIIHGDLFVDNIFFNKDKLSGVIDFYFSANDFFMYEIAICINALCFDKKKNKFLINKQKVKNLIKGYESVRKITIGEKKSLNILCRGAAIRYLLTRLYDYSNTPKTALIQIKDPNEYYQKLITHNNLSSYKDYLF